MAQYFKVLYILLLPLLMISRRIIIESFDEGLSDERTLNFIINFKNFKFKKIQKVLGLKKIFYSTYP